MTIAQQAVVEACNDLGIKYSLIHRDKISIFVVIGKYRFYFTHKRNPFNRTDVRRITSDKDLTYSLFKDVVNVPMWKAYLDPNVKTIYPINAEGFPTRPIEEIITDIQKSFALPFIIKPNMKSRGINVFQINKDLEIRQALEKIFDQTNMDYDYIALAQDRIDILHEYRVVVFRKKVKLVYEKSIEQAHFVGNLSPLHWEGAKAVHITEQGLFKQFEDFIAPIYEKLDLQYAGFDIAIDKKGIMWLIEINTQPQIEIFVEHNELQPIVDMNKKIFLELMED